MKIQTNYQPLLARGERAFREAATETLRIAQAEASRHSRTGEHAASLRLGTPTGQPDSKMSVTLGSSLPQARAVERGADVGPRRGPHMRGIHAVKIAVERYPETMTRKLREAAR